ncbi:RHS repeat-associated core domain-containing protein [Streptomyces sp. NPDC001435]|uniref:RHS repeat-associated core domain-containing protein n=1 Tax=Streptomyces sp. NPDC001435 TaxID=3364576 RepID=UPI0036D108F0
MNGKPWQRVRRRTALTVSATLVGALIQVVTGQSAAADPSAGRPTVHQADKPVTGHGRKVKPRKQDTSPLTPKGEPAAAWPASGTATAAVPAARTTAKGLAAGNRFGRLPLSVRAPKSAVKAADRVTKAGVRVLDRKAARRAGVGDGLLLAVDRADAGTRAGKVGLQVDYARFAEAYGGGYGSRLHLVRLPACALTTPDKASCRTATPLAAVNDTEHRTLTADTVTVPAKPAGKTALAAASSATVLAVTAAASGSQGDYTATALSPSATWQTSLNTGDFSWSYDMDVPDVPGSLVPNVGLTYSSGSIDGRTTTSNNQSSWVGDGFDLWPGSIERSYKSCDDDGVKVDGNKPGDLCWGYDNATLSFNGHGGELIQDSDGKWHLKNDDGTRVERLTGSSSDARDNGDNNQEYWKVTTTDGTQYFFGYNKLPGWASGKETTDSTWTVPVYGDDAGEPCHASTFADSWCQQAWRWNLDYVVDPSGNAMAYYYDQETNSYGRALKAADDTPYVRGGSLDRIEYGLRSDTVYSAKALGKVEFTSTERCIPETGVTCAADTIDDKSFYWYDTPWDQNCKAGTDCTGQYAPTFWTRKRLANVTTQLLKSDGTYGDVDSWDLTQRWGQADIDYQLLLDSIQHTGKSATPAVTLPKVTFTYHQDANRLDRTGDGTAPFIKARVSNISDESGGQISVNYSAAACSWDSLPTPETNTTRCYPQYYTASGDVDPSLQWFNKYVVTSVTQTDRTGQSPDSVTEYSYLDGAAWHYDDDEGLTKEKYKTWSQWRGYRHVRVESGGTSGMTTQADHYFLRGMNGDRLNKDGGTKDVTLDDGEGATIADWEALAGFEYRTENYSGPGGRLLNKAVNHGWFHETARRTRSWGTSTANHSGTDWTHTYTSLDDGAGAKWRETTSYTTFDDATGRATQVNDLGQTGDSTDDQCTRTTYADNPSANIYSLVSRVETVSVKCETTPQRDKQVISDVRTAYDGTDYGAAPTKGEARYTATLTKHDGSTATYLEKGTGYDTYGRAVSTTDITADVKVDSAGKLTRTARSDGHTTTTVYTPTTGIPTGYKVTGPPARTGDSTTAQSVTTSVDPLRGETTAVVDTNGKRIDYTYDGLGRSLKVWLPNRSKAGSQTPNYEFSYTIADAKAPAVGTRTLKNDGTQETSYDLYDGFLRPTQTQDPGPAGGRLLTDTFYDARGLTAKTFASHYNTSPPSTTPLVLDNALAVETQTWFSYDGLGRETQRKEVAGNGDGGTVLSTTTTAYGGDRVTVTPPKGQPATTTISDARGRTSELWQYHGNTPTGDHDVTAYEYTPAGKLSKVIDPAGNKWTDEYDLLGRTIRATDPDKGTTVSTYDDRGNLLTVKDDRTKDAGKVTLAYAYDDLGRKTEERSGGASGPLLAKWTYDTVTNAKGQLGSWTRYDGTNEYTTTVNAYDGLYRPTRTTTTIPASEGALQGSYQQDTSYNLDGTVKGVSYPAAGSLPGESFTYGYDDTHRQITATGTSTYLTNVDYSFTGKPEQVETATTGGKKTWLSSTYEWGTQRLKTSRVDREGVSGVDRSTTYGYDESGDILSISDVSRDGTDNQCFQYDYLQRLTEAWAQGTTDCAAAPSTSLLGGPAPYWRSYTYDRTASGASEGNRATEVVHDPSGDTAKDVKHAYSYPPAGTTQAHTLTQVDTTGPSGNTSRDSYSYDEIGNTHTRTIGGNTQTLDWDAEGHLAKVSEPDGNGGTKTTTYLYDVDGNRLVQRTPTETTLYLGSSEITLAKGATKAKCTRYYDLGNGVEAVRGDDNKVSFSVADHQGTGQLSVDAATQALQQRRTTPFGTLRGTKPAAWPGTEGFVGGTQDTATGLTHLGAREYDESLGRFISVDPLMNMDDPQSFNGYAYSDNNPVTLSDPNGTTHCDVVPEMCHPQKPTGGYCPSLTNPKCPEYQGGGGNGNGGGGGSVGGHVNNQDVAKAKKIQKTSLMDVAKNVGWEVFKSFIGWDDFTGCLNGGVSSCVSLLIDAIPWGTMFKKGAELIKGAWKLSKAAMKFRKEQKWARKIMQEAEEAAEDVGKVCPVKHSFLPGTKVLMADGSVENIEDVRTGDEVVVTDPETGKTSTKKVVATITTEDDKDFTTLTVATGKYGMTTSMLTATDTHPFWVPELHAWIQAGELKPGEGLRTSTGTRVRITAVSHWTELHRTHDLTVDEVHDYYVVTGDVGVLVHNMGRKPGQRPNYSAEGPHTTFVRHGGTGQIKKYAEWAPQSNPRNPAPFELVKRFDLEGPAHTNADGTVVETPHINSPNGGDARAPEDWEKPLGCS